ncbi:MAG: cell division protein FtsW [Ignavibacteria bacterium]|nr:cell division protein FtsW [Ignavibacteria bacterium]
MKLKGYRIDIWILLPVLFLIIFSIGAVYSASSYFSMETFNDSNYLLKQHLIRVAIALTSLFIFAKIDYRYYQDIGKLLIWVSIFLLLFIYIGGVSEVKGASRWISIGPVSFQPADFAKFTLIIYISHLLVKKKNYVHLLYKGYLPILFYIILITVLVAFQPNFSTALIIFGSSLVLLILSNVKLKHIVYTVVSLIPFGVIFVLSKAYIVKRLTSHADFTTGGDSHYQLQQAIIGFGNGGLFGMGPGNSLQREFFLPEAHGDFIFSIIGEEYGYIGVFILIILFAFILIRGYKVAKKVKDDFGKYLAFGITTLITSYAVVNMSVACGLIPTTGVPIPFVSYGGTALIVNSIAVGILLNISSFCNESQVTFSDDYVDETKNYEI